MEIRIKNVSGQVTADSLAAIFSTYGNVVSASLYAPVRDSRSKTAVIVMPDEREALLAIEQLNGCFVDGQTLMVEKEVTGKRALVGGFYRQARIFFTGRKPLSIFG
ncbi:MAG TPA: RNA-binding protein [Flavisolibacter sp.]|nr:RNA-binding protein [Flavisolibacter sp.]